MIDIESELFSVISNAMKSAYPDSYVSGEYVKTPPKFPAVLFVEMDNVAYDKTQTSDNVENHADLMYEVDVFSNKKSGKKSECKAIASLIDNELAALGFSRLMLQPIPNVDDATIYRIKGRYRAVASKDNTIFRR